MFGLKLFLEFPLARRQRRLAAGRAAISKEQFVSAVSSSDIGRLAAGMLWEKLGQVTADDRFTPYPHDDLTKVFGLAEEDLDEDVILNITGQLGLPVPSKKTLDKFGPVNTPEDIVRLVESIPT